MFSLKGIEEGHVPLTRHFECDVEVGGQVVHCVGILVKKDKIPLVDSKGRKAKTPALLSSKLIHIALNEFCETFGEECLRLFECPKGISPLLFSTLCLYYFAHFFKTAGVGALSVKSDDPSNDKDKGSNTSNASGSKESKSQNNSNHQTKTGQSAKGNKSDQND